MQNEREEKTARAREPEEEKARKIEKIGRTMQRLRKKTGLWPCKKTGKRDTMDTPWDEAGVEMKPLDRLSGRLC